MRTTITSSVVSSLFNCFNTLTLKEKYDDFNRRLENRNAEIRLVFCK